MALILCLTQGFWKCQAYIATQYPLEDTTQDFWRMVWQENCRSLIMLLSKEEMEQVMCYPSPLACEQALLSVW